MKRARFRFFGPLNAFLDASRRQVSFEYAFWGTPAVKDAIEALGVPHTEVAFIQANGAPVAFTHGLQAGDDVFVYPRFGSLAPDPEHQLVPSEHVPPRFALDAHLGRLAKYLRMLGFDTRYRNDYDDAELAALARDESRILLTRDRGLLKRSVVVHGYYVHAVEPRRQLDEVLQRFGLNRHFAPLTRCLQCNAPLAPVDKDDVADRLPPNTARYFDTFYRCAACDKVYWKGSHYDDMRRRIEGL